MYHLAEYQNWNNLFHAKTYSFYLIDKLLNFVLIDKNNGIYPGGLGTKVLEKLSILGLNVIFCPIVDKIHPDRHDPGILLKIIRQIAGQNNDDTTTLHH